MRKTPFVLPAGRDGVAQCLGSSVIQREQWVQTDQPWRRAVIEDGNEMQPRPEKEQERLI